MTFQPICIFVASTNCNLFFEINKLITLLIFINQFILYILYFTFIIYFNNLLELINRSEKPKKVTILRLGITEFEFCSSLTLKILYVKL